MAQHFYKVVYMHAQKLMRATAQQLQHEKFEQVPEQSDGEAKIEHHNQ